MSELVIVERISLEVVDTGRTHVGYRELDADGGVQPGAPIAKYEECNLDDAGERRQISPEERDAKPLDLRCLRCLGPGSSEPIPIGHTDVLEPDPDVADDAGGERY